MKKNILILIIMMLLFTGCNKDEMSKVNNDNEVKVQDNVIDNNKVQSITDNEEEVLDDNINEPIVEQVEEVTTTTTKKITTKKTTTGKITTTVKSKTTTTKKSEEETDTTTTKKAEEEITFYVPSVGHYYIDSYDAKYPYSVFFSYSAGTPIYSTAKGKISRVFINDLCKITLDDKDNPDLIFADIVIYHRQNLYSVYRCVKDPVFSKSDIGKEVTENTVIGYIGKHSNSAGDIVSAFGFSFQKQPRLDLYYSSLGKIVIEPSLYIGPFGAKRSGYVSNRNVR